MCVCVCVCICIYIYIYIYIIEREREREGSLRNPDMFTPTSGYPTEICPERNSDYKLQAQKSNFVI